ncbi:MAG: recombinase family protein, partial [Phycisphaerales bacterium]|nr:recombinase family protein [Phycisphaerales bacterium]
MSIKKPRAVRCAVYTRKSTDENLDRDFNSLDAQRECCELYVASMRNEGWVCLPERYDDGGFSGGNTDRPALKRLLDDIRAGRVDTVVAYKIDRLSRSLLDFARLSETFETNKVSFVSVTQQFNSSDSMGRLTLNMLMSFAQFEREVISDRTRDKIAATRRRGRWTGGRPVLGYRVDPATRGLVIEPAEAERVRAIFEIYLEKRSLLATANELAGRGWVTKSSAGRSGRTWGGRPYDKTNLQKLLRCVLYTGKLPFQGNLYDGEHGRIVEPEVFAAVQELLKSNGRDGGMHVRNKHGALLKGVLECSACGTAMVHTFTNKSDKAYRYYRCCNAMRRGAASCPCPTLPAEQLEGLVLEQVRARLDTPAVRSATLHRLREDAQAQLEPLEGRLAASRRQS